MAYNGEERRTEYCGMHKDNVECIKENTAAVNVVSSEVHAIKGSMFQARWVIGLLIGIGALIIGSTLNDIKGSIKSIESDIKIMLPLESRVERLERTVEYNSNTRITELERFSHEHK